MRQSSAMPVVAMPAAEPLAGTDEAMLDALQHDAFEYFLAHTDHDNGLVADTSRANSYASIAVIGFALSAGVGIARSVGWTCCDAAPMIASNNRDCRTGLVR